MNSLSWSASAYEKIADLVGARTGLSFSPNVRDQAEAGIRRAMGRMGVGDLVLYGTKLQSDGAALDDLLCELTVGETYFLRDPAQFEFLRREILPEVLGRRGPDHVLRLLSAGCSTGEEAYSLAILLEEEGLAANSRIVATDISRVALEKARLGIYGRWSLRGTGEDFAGRHFHAREGQYQLKERFRRAVAFQHLNLAEDTYPAYASGLWGFDVIFCRNVLIYFGGKAIEGVVPRLFESLAPGGWLVAGASDPPLADYAPCQVILTGAGVFYRRSGGEGPLPISPRASGSDMLPLFPPNLGPAGGEEEERCTGREPTVAARTTDGDAMVQAAKAFAQGEYARVLALIEGLSGTPGAEALRVRAVANLRGSLEAERTAGERISRYPTNPELHYLHAILLIDLGQDDRAIGCLKKVLYLDPSLAVANLMLGTLLKRKGDRAGAGRALKRSLELLTQAAKGQVVPLSQGESAESLALLTRSELSLLEAGL